MHTIAELEAIIPTLKNPSFAESLVKQSKTKTLSDKQLYWVNKLVEEASQPEKPTTNVGDLSRIIALFDHAKAHLKFPAIILNVPKAGCLIRINVAGAQAKHPGTLNVTSGEKPMEGASRIWYGRVMKDGNYAPSASSPGNAIAERLIEFAKDPGSVAREYAKSTMELVDGVLVGRCCFCNLHLQDERSTAVGYGKTCAKNYGLPWGSK